MKKLTTPVKVALYLLIPVLFFYGIIQARNFLYPLAFGLLFAYLLFPVVNFLEHHNFPRILAIVVTIISAVAVIGSAFFVYYKQLTLMFDDFDTLQKRANQNIEMFQQYLNQTVGLENNRLQEFLEQQGEQLFGNENGQLRKAFSATTGTLFKIFIMPVYVFLFLYYRTKFAYFILKMVNRKNKQVVINILREISTVASRYMGGVFVVVIILCVINSAGLLIIGVEYAILLGVLSAVFNFIPYFGTLMGGVVPLTFVLLASDDPLNLALAVIILFVIIQFIENNILTPNIVGGNVQISPFFIIVGLILGALVWGIPGMLVTVPFLAIARIIFVNIKKTRHIGFLLGPKGTQKHSITKDKIQRFFSIKKEKNI
jgi:predicted PurR-regulated permease PerM